jgi:cytokinesis protein
VNNTTLLHFLERTVTKHFPEMEHFLDELERPAETYRGMSLSEKEKKTTINGFVVNLADRATCWIQTTAPRTR